MEIFSKRKIFPRKIVEIFSKRKEKDRKSLRKMKKVLPTFWQSEPIKAQRTFLQNEEKRQNFFANK